MKYNSNWKTDLFNDIGLFATTRTMEDIAKELDFLPLELKKIMAMKYLGNLPMTEIAKKMGLSYNMVVNRRDKAIRMIRGGTLSFSNR